MHHVRDRNRNENNLTTYLENIRYVPENKQKFTVWSAVVVVRHTFPSESSGVPGSALVASVSALRGAITHLLEHCTITILFSRSK